MQVEAFDRLARDGVGAKLSLWQGDITTIEADAIVNAANSGLTGCFIPNHPCIDNAIHRVAGPGLLEECQAHIAEQGHYEPTGSAVLTDGYGLPAKHVLHTVGPIVRWAAPDDDDAGALASCYTSCLDAAAEAGLRSVVFCSISTGAFGYPIELAAPVAIEAVAGWFELHPDDDVHVVFNTFSDADTAVYEQALADFLA